MPGVPPSETQTLPPLQFADLGTGAPLQEVSGGAFVGGFVALFLFLTASDIMSVASGGVEQKQL